MKTLLVARFCSFPCKLFKKLHLLIQRDQYDQHIKELIKSYGLKGFALNALHWRENVYGEYKNTNYDRITEVIDTAKMREIRDHQIK
jgi:hypothetical protein